MKRIPFLRLSDSNAAIKAELTEAARRVIESGHYLHGPETKAFEQELAAACGGGQLMAIGTSNGLDALRLILRGYMEMGRLIAGDEVIVPANTFIASVLAISECGLQPVIAEPSAITMNLDFEDARRRINNHTKAVMLVHLYGTPCWDPEFADEMRKRGILLIEDNAQAIGAKARQPGFNGTYETGGLADAAGISFYPAKNIGALGDAGAVVTADKQLASTIRALANYGSHRKYQNIYRGYNCRLDEIQAAMLRVQLRRLKEISDRRRHVASRYDALIRNAEIQKPRIFQEMEQVWHQYVIRTPHRVDLIDHLDQHGVDTMIHYAVPPHMQPCYANSLGGPFPIAELLAGEVVSLPIANVSDTETDMISEAVNSFKS